MPNPARSLARVALAFLVTAAACGNPPVVSTERAPGSTNGGGSNQGGGSGSGGGTPGGGNNGAPTISIPDAAPAGVDMKEPMACAAEAHKAEAVPLDLLLLVDASGSMDTRVGVGMATKWTLAQNALVGFVRDARSAGLGVGVQFFPYQKECMADTDCGVSTISRCRGRSSCIDPAGVAGGMCFFNAAGVATCPVGTSCAMFGTCSDSANGCMNVGQPCANNEGMCEAGPKYCQYVTGLSECDVVNYEAPAVGIAALPGNQLPLVRALRAKGPTGGTPMRPAVEGALKQLRAHLEKNPGRKAVLVLASDGLPSCSPLATNGIPAVAELVRAANMGTPAISTYVVGVFTANEAITAKPQLDMVAMAGGSTESFVVTANDDLGMRLQEALDTIRGAALACDFKIPPPKDGKLDYGKVNVRFTPTGANASDLSYVRSMAGCDPTRGGWYYDVDPAMGTPARILVCPSTCEKFKKDGSAKVDLLFGCTTIID